LGGKEGVYADLLFNERSEHFGRGVVGKQKPMDITVSFLVPDKPKRKDRI
jgi:hypothetical protein